MNATPTGCNSKRMMARMGDEARGPTDPRLEALLNALGNLTDGTSFSGGQLERNHRGPQETGDVVRLSDEFSLHLIGIPGLEILEGVFESTNDGLPGDNGERLLVSGREGRAGRSGRNAQIFLASRGKRPPIRGNGLSPIRHSWDIDSEEYSRSMAARRMAQSIRDRVVSFAAVSVVTQANNSNRVAELLLR